MDPVDDTVFCKYNIGDFQKDILHEVIWKGLQDQGDIEIQCHKSSDSDGSEKLQSSSMLLWLCSEMFAKCVQCHQTDFRPEEIVLILPDFSKESVQCLIDYMLDGVSDCPDELLYEELKQLVHVLGCKGQTLDRPNPVLKRKLPAGISVMRVPKGAKERQCLPRSISPPVIKDEVPIYHEESFNDISIKPHHQEWEDEPYDNLNEDNYDMTFEMEPIIDVKEENRQRVINKSTIRGRGRLRTDDVPVIRASDMNYGLGTSTKISTGSSSRGRPAALRLGPGVALLSTLVEYNPTPENDKCPNCSAPTTTVEECLQHLLDTLGANSNQLLKSRWYCQGKAKCSVCHLKCGHREAMRLHLREHLDEAHHQVATCAFGCNGNTPYPTV